MTLATEKGESGAEAIALEVGAYMGECIRIIEFYGGDVVKFLGDAVLVCFQPNTTGRSHSPDSSPLPPEDHEVSARKKNMLMRRAVECGLQLLARLSHYQVYLTAEERTKHRNASGEIRRGSQDESDSKPRYSIFDVRNEYERQSQQSPSQQEHVSASSSADNIRSLSFSRWGVMNILKRMFLHGQKKKQQRRLSVMSEVSTHDLNTIDLELHIALACGDVTNIVIGELDPDENEKQWANSYRNSLLVKQGAMTTRSNYYLQYHGRLEYAIGGPVVESLDDALAVAKAGEMSITKEAYERIRRLTMDYLSYDQRDGFYVVRDRDPDGNHGMHPSKSSSMQPFRQGAHHHQVNPNANYLQDMPGLMRQASQLNIEPLVPRIRNKSYMELSAEANPYYFKYVSRSAVYRLSRTPDGNFQAQFRDATVMFVSLGKVDVVTDEGLQIVQDAMKAVTKSLVRYEGVLQQFAIDDKGATLLCVFGLPPFSHEREAVFAAKAAIDVRDQYRKLKFPEFAISLATGVVFNAVVPQGNPFRRDPGIAGDVIILAVRMLKFPFSKKHVICDEATKQQIGGLCDFDDVGENYVKGKIKPVQIYSIRKFGLWAGKGKRLPVHPTNDDFVGYTVQMERATTFFNDWCEMHNYHLMVISGASGSGKTYFCQNLQESITSDDVVVCWSSCTEVEKRTKYFLLRSMLTSLMELIASSAVPQTTDAPISPGSKASFTPDPECIVEVNEKSEISPDLSGNLLRRLHSYKKKSHNALPISQDVTESDIKQNILYCLHKCGEDDNYLPLFNVIFPSMSGVEESAYTERLDERTRERLLCNLILRMVQFVSKTTNLVLFCDDLQWADHGSIECLKQMHQVCSKIMLIIATRKPRDYQVPFIDDMRKTGSFEHIMLNGLNSDEIGDVVLKSFPKSVEKVSPAIIRVIQERTHGNPLYVKNVAILLKDFNHVTVLNGRLVPSSNRFDLEDLLGDFNFKRIIKMQYDRLDTSFQEFLVVASCLDQYFSVYEVGAVIKSSNEMFIDHNLDQIREEIRKHDIYKFLEPGYHGNSLENTADLYSFTHIAVPDSIYDMVSFETRNDLHQKLARYYEGKLDRGNYAQLLGKVTRHYLQTDRLGKQLYYLEALARLDMRSLLLPEAARHLQQIVIILEANEDLAAQYGLIHRSDIYRKLGICLTMRSEFREGEKYLLKSLHCLGFPWPDSNFEFFRRFWMIQFSQWRHRHGLIIRKHHAMVKKALGLRVIEVMMQLCHIYHLRGIGDLFVYACSVGLNVCERIQDTGYRYTYFLGRAALLNWLNDHKTTGVYYMSRALVQMGDSSDPGTLNTCALLCFSSGQYKKACKLLYQSLEATQTLGVVTSCQEFYRGVRLIATIRIFEGTLDTSPGDQALLKQMADTAHCNGDYQVEIWLAIYQVANALVMCRLRDARPFVLLLEAQVMGVPDYLRVAIHGTLVYYYARCKKRRRAFKHTAHFLSYLPTLTTTANILPVYGLIFGAMAFYHMAEVGDREYYTAVNERFDIFIESVNSLNRAFQKVKFWEFMQPCLYLARALQYISTDRTVEGYTVLYHGLNEMHFMHEIRFLKAFYCSVLGKYAFTAEERTDWTNQAKEAFVQLGIPHAEYCNPDPSLPARTAMMRSLPSTQPVATENDDGNAAP
ncbi:hypothetical protein BDB00DRAFT_953131 [Zychaea mexicana]|uniref:uncharacterized protein n=1 Tax=Zychaea mexicana TaxID=64656 RepID=UPI0022FEF8A8|nr:uncharacterized protein BDB00DRAFT_953131 [Zychaea mexicana]KAI9496217.1 hypothetical protein BDB00DRAFT_953131 [Zychaea mexicana]